MSRLTSPYLWLSLFAAGIAVAFVAGTLLVGSAAGIDRGLQAFAVAALGTAAVAGWWRAYRQSGRTSRAEQALEAVRQSTAGSALRDPVTGMGNHRLFDVSLRTAVALAQRYGRSFTVLLIEVNAPEQLRSGPRPTGYERVLKYVASVLGAGLRQSDTAARISETMFGVVLFETDYEGTIVAWDRLREAARSNWPDSRSWSLSGGAASYSVETASVESLLSDADRRLALEKRRLRTEPES